MSKQINTYEIYDSCGRATSIYYYAPTKKDAMKLWKADTENYRRYGWGKLVRLYGASQDTERRSY